MRISDWSSDVCSSDLPGIIWVVALLAMLLSLERLFLADFEDGSLEQLLLSPLPLELAVLAKVLAHWLTTGLPLIVAAPLLAVLFHMAFAGLGVDRKSVG